MSGSTRRSLPIASIGDGAKALRAIQRNWALYSWEHHRRAALIEAKLPPVRPKPIAFPSEAPKAPLGSWTLLDANTILAAARCSSPFRHGEVEFIENKTAPPNRAYLKLWEALTLLETRPKAGDICVDLGASPGGWTWVLQEAGARVIAVDKAPLAPSVASLARVEFASGERLRARPTEDRPDRLAVLRHHLLSAAPADAGAALAGGGDGAALRLHDQVPGQDRPRHRA